MILPADIDPRAVLGADAMSNSELGTLARCEQAWVLGYTGEREKSGPSVAMQRGTEIHRLWGSWWLGNWGGTATSEDPTAALLMSRYDSHCGEQRYAGAVREQGHTTGGRPMPEGPGLHCVGNEVPVTARFSWGSWFFGFADGLFQVTGVDNVPDGLYVGEAKSTDKLSAMTYLVQSTQTPLYVWAFRQMGLPVIGSFIDGLRTSGNEPKIETKDDCYKRLRKELAVAGLKETAAETKARIEENRLTLGEPPLAESFDRRWLLEADGTLDIDGALGQARRANGVRRILLEGDTPLKNIGPSCSWCFGNAVCFGLDVEVEDDDAEQPF